MNIAIDLDEVLAEYLESVIRYHNDTYNTSLKKTDFFSYNFWEVWGGTKEEAIEKVHDFITTDYFNQIQTVKGAYEGVLKLKERHELYIVTARQDIVSEKTIDFIEDNFRGVFSGVYFANHFSKSGISKEKSEICKELDIEIIVEDSVTYANECQSKGIATILLKKPWNTGYELLDNIYIANSWKEVPNYIFNLK